MLSYAPWNWVSFPLFLLTTPLATGTSVFITFSPSSSLFTSVSCSESLASISGEKRYWTNEWLESHCQMAAVEQLGWGSRALSWGSYRQERQCSWYQHTRLWRLETRSFLPETKLKSAQRTTLDEWRTQLTERFVLLESDVNPFIYSAQLSCNTSS